VQQEVSLTGKWNAQASNFNGFKVFLREIEMAHGSVDGERWMLVVEYVVNNRGHEGSDTRFISGVVRGSQSETSSGDVETKRAGETAAGANQRLWF
jgi:hypothetical protein